MNSRILRKSEPKFGRRSFSVLVRRVLQRSDSGQGLVEFAITLPFLLLLLLGTIEVGRGIQVWLTVNNAAAVGARTAAVGGSEADVKLAVRNAATTLIGDNLEIQVVNAGGLAGQAVTVRVSYGLTALTPVFEDLTPGGVVNVSAAAVQRLE